MNFVPVVQAKTDYKVIRKENTSIDEKQGILFN